MKARSLSTRAYAISIARIFIIVILVVNPWIGFTQENGNEPAPRKAVLTFIGNKTDSTVVQLEVKNERLEKVVLSVITRDGVVLYKETFTDKIISRKFQFPKEMQTDVIFNVTDERDRNKQSFEIKTRLVEEVFVAKAN